MPTEESQIKGQVREYLRLRGIFFYHNLQGIGSFGGLPDMGMHWQGQVHYLEIKKPKGKLSFNQLTFQLQCKIDGVPYHVIRCLEDLIAVVNYKDDKGKLVVELL